MAVPTLNEIINWIISASKVPSNQPLFYFCDVIVFLCLFYIAYWLTLYFLNKRSSYYFMEVQFPHVEGIEIPQFIERMKTVFASLQGFILSKTDKITFEIYKVDSYITMQIGSNSKSVLEQTAGNLTQIRNVVIKDVK